jgi:glycosyltransferase involved in cell wall biosynthesis
MCKPLLSVCLITYNHANYIREAIEGVLIQQVNFCWELIIADDFSTDGTREIVLAYKEKYPEFIKLILQEKNVGPSQNYFDLINTPSSKYIAYFEGDDYWTDPLKLQKQLEFLETNEDYGLAWTDVDFYSQSSGVFKRGVFKNSILPIYHSFNDILMNRPFFASLTWVFRREYRPKQINDYCDGTFPMILDIVSETKIKYFNEVTATYRRLDESASNSRSALKRYTFFKGVHRIQKDYIKKYELPKAIEEQVDFKHFEAAYPYAVIFRDIKSIEKGKIILKNSRHSNVKVKCALFLSNFLLGVFILKVVYNNTLLKNLIANLPIFRRSS